MSWKEIVELALFAISNRNRILIKDIYRDYNDLINIKHTISFSGLANDEDYCIVYIKFYSEKHHYPHKMMFRYHNDNTIHIITSVIDYKIIDLDDFDPLTFTLENGRPNQYTTQCFNILKEVINELG